MAPDPEKPTAADKGKGKAVDEPKSDKPAANGKKEDGKIIDSAEELSEEDQQLKNELDMLVERLTRIMLELPDEIVGDDQELQDSLTNIKLSEHFKSLGKELNILEPKTTEDIYKSHLESSRVAGMTNLDSARHNLAAAFVNGFVNAGFGNDKMMLVEEDKESWVWKTKGDGMMSTVASLGTLLQWDVENALDKIDKQRARPSPPWRQ
ncbi:26S proteasome regulatory subunit rpn-1 like protein [Verticillium longisporum]|nr:26S proteasome regulatory subunit rpn-1 like protein [Verticillium longisporum]